MGKWLFALEENNPSLLFPLELVNWDKMRHVWRIVADHQRCCSDFYNFPIVKVLYPASVPILQSILRAVRLQCGAGGEIVPEAFSAAHGRPGLRAIAGR
jgi:hypothetical protein